MQYQCDYCKENYTKLATLLSHIRQIHKDAFAKKPFQCKECSRTFISSLILKNHNKSKHNQKIRAEDLIFKCTKCPAKFSQAKSLEVHVQKFHNDAQDKTFKCDQCDETFALKRVFNKHQKKMHMEATSKTCKKA